VRVQDHLSVCPVRLKSVTAESSMFCRSGRAGLYIAQAQEAGENRSNNTESLGRLSCSISFPLLKSGRESKLRWGQEGVSRPSQCVPRGTSVNSIFRQTNLMSCKIMYWETGQMRMKAPSRRRRNTWRRSSRKKSRLTRQAQWRNGSGAVSLVWKEGERSDSRKCSEWNAVTQEETLTCKKLRLEI